jgi:hypothetical protein
MKNKSNSLAADKILKEFINNYAINKVIDWRLKSKLDEGHWTEFKWSPQDKNILQEIVNNREASAEIVELNDKKFKNFIDSIIQNGLNSDDLILYQRFKYRLPLRAFGLIYDLNDFHFQSEHLISKIMIDSGFYMIEIEYSPKVYRSNIPVVLTSTHPGVENKQEFKMIARHGKISKRLIKMTEDCDLTIYIDQLRTADEIFKLRIVRLNKNFFTSRMLKKLGQPQEFDKVQNISDFKFNKLWLDYNSIFMSQFETSGTNYHNKIISHENKYRASLAKQIQLVKRWIFK